MSRIGRSVITVPAGVEVNINDRHVAVKGPKGSMEHTLPEQLEIVRAEDGTLEVRRFEDDADSASLHGLNRTLVNNMIVGVTDGYERKLEIVGTGYRVALKGRDLDFQVGYSHNVLFSAPEGITFTVESPTAFSVAGIDKQLVGEVAANIRKIRKPEPYKGKGIRYAGEFVRRKVGKAGK